jgi:hypothetical protein
MNSAKNYFGPRPVREAEQPDASESVDIRNAGTENGQVISILF